MGQRPTGSDLTGLPVGSYCVTATDANGCQVVACPELIVCPTIIVNPTLVIEKPSSCTAQDGMVRVLSWGISSTYQTSYDYVFHSESGEVFQSTATGKYLNLASGIYTLLVTDQNNECTGSYDINLLSEHYPDIEAFIFPACAGMPTGKVGVAALGSGYTFEWQDSEAGVVTELDDIYSELSGVYEGNYCVTISSDDSDCVVEKCYDIPSVLPESPLTASGVTTNPCPRSRNGAINLTVSGGIAPYTFDWNDVINPEEEVEDRAGLAAGNFLVTVTDYCGASVTLSFELSILEIESIVFTPGCEDEGSAAVSIVGGNAPYSYLWKNGGTTPTIQGLSSGEYCLTLTDAGGCSVAECSKGQNKEYTLSVVEPCEGLAEGVITIKISNPGGGYVHVVMDGVSLYENTTTNAAFDLNIPSLTGGNTYNFDITIQDCVYPDNSVSLEIQPIKHIFDHYDAREEKCYWNDACNDVVIPGSTVITNPFFDMYNGTGDWLTSCTVPVSCGGNHVDDKGINKKWVRAAEYKVLLKYAIDQGFYDFNYLQNLQQYFYGGGHKDCDKIRFCPASMKITSSINGFFNGNGSATHIDGTTCYELNCGIGGINSEDFCLDALVPNVFGNVINTPNVSPEDPIFECDPATQNLLQLSYWASDLSILYGDTFNLSSLKGLIDLYWDTPEARCIRVTFCQSNFSILSSNIGDINCGNPPFNCETPSTDEPDLCFRYACIDDAYYTDEPWTLTLPGNEIVEFFGHWEWVCNTPFPGEFLIAPDDTANEFYKTLSYPTEQAQFINLGKAISEGECMPKGLVKTGNQYQYVDYAIHSKWDVLQNIPAIIDFVDDWDSEAITLVRKAEENQFAVEQFANDQYAWSKVIGSTQQVSVTYFEQQDSNYVVGGEFTGVLQFNQVTLATENAKSAYVLLVDESGNLLDSKIASNIGLNGKLCFSKNEGGITIAGYSGTSTVKVDGEIKVVDNQSIVDISIDKEGLTDTRSVFSLDSTLKIIKLIESADGNYKTYMFQGNGNYVVDNATYAVSNPNSLVLLTINSNEEIIWHDKINHAGNLTEGSFDALYDQKYNLLVGLTYHDSVSVGAHSFVSAGSDDILILSFSETGEVMSGISYGSSDEEKVSKLMLCGETLYFGGEFSGATSTRSIGKYEFFATNTSTPNPFISLIPLSDLGKQELKTSNRSQKTHTVLAKSNVKVFPNPVTDMLKISIDSPIPGKVFIKLFDAFGKTIRHENEFVAIGQNTLLINSLNQIPAGVYFIQVVDAEGRQWNERVVKN